MKVSQLFEQDDDEPLLVTILRNALVKGKEVRVYYKGDGGKITAIEWDPPNGPNHPGSSSFKLTDNRWVVIGNQNIDKLETTTRTGDLGREIIVAKQAPGRVAEGMMDGRDWVDARDAEFKKIISDAGWMLKKPPSHGLENGYFGGTIRATAAAKRSLLDLAEQRRLIMKMLGKKFIALAREGSHVIISPHAISGFGGRKMDRLNVRPETQIALIIDTLEDGMFLKMDGSAFDAYWYVSIPTDIVDHVTSVFANAMEKTTK